MTAVVGGLVVLAGARAADGVVTSAGHQHHVHDTTKVVRYHVQPGDTLWSIAQRLAPGQDPRAVVDLLVQAHGGPTIQPGDVIDWAGT
jgi:Tfp pilus assembly protein FimV